MADIINQAYMRTMYKNTTVLSGISFYPFTTNFDKELERSVSVLGAAIFPLCLSMGLPVFIYFLVLEKEQKLVEFMKINGMKMYNYWLINFLFNIFLYNVTALVFIFFGWKIYNMQLFRDTNFFVMLFILEGWGLA